MTDPRSQRQSCRPTQKYEDGMPLEYYINEEIKMKATNEKQVNSQKRRTSPTREKHQWSVLERREMLAERRREGRTRDTEWSVK